jgi:hypothetical protein
MNVRIEESGAKKHKSHSLIHSSTDPLSLSHTHTHTHTHTYVHTYTHMYIYTHIHIHTVRTERLQLGGQALRVGVHAGIQEGGQHRRIDLHTRVSE